MRQLLKSMNYAAQLMALIDIGKAIKRWATKSNTKKQKERPKIKTLKTSPSKKPPTTQKKKRNRLISQRLRFFSVIPTGFTKGNKANFTLFRSKCRKTPAKHTYLLIFS